MRTANNFYTVRLPAAARPRTAPIIFINVLVAGGGEKGRHHHSAAAAARAVVAGSRVGEIGR